MINKRKEDIIVDNFDDILKYYQLPIISIYENPVDYPNKYVARLFDCDKLTNFIIVKNSLQDISIPDWFIKVPRSEEDPPQIICSYMG